MMHLHVLTDVICACKTDCLPAPAGHQKASTLEPCMCMHILVASALDDGRFAYTIGLWHSQGHLLVL